MLDRRTSDAKAFGSLAQAFKGGLAEDGEGTDLVYARAERCRICVLHGSDLPNANHVRRAIDRELLNNSTYKGALEAVEDLVDEWPTAQRPTYAAVRNHARHHLRWDATLARRLMEAHAEKDGIDIEQGDGPIFNPGGALATIAQKGTELVRDGRLTPTVAETIAANRALSAIEEDRLREDLASARTEARLLRALLQELAPDALASVASSTFGPPLEPESVVLALPESSDGDDPPPMESEIGFPCDECATVARSKGGLTQHRNSRHPCS